LQLRYELRNRQAEQKLFASGPVAVMIWSIESDWPVIYAAENISTVVGYEVEDVKRSGFQYLKIVYPEDRALLREALRALSDGSSNQLELDYRVLTAHGELRWVRQVSRADTDEKGTVTRIRGYLLEQTQRKQLEMVVQDANERFTLALDAGDMSTWDWDMTTNRVHFDDRWLKDLGWPESQALELQSDWLTWVHPKDLATMREVLRRHSEGELP